MKKYIVYITFMLVNICIFTFLLIYISNTGVNRREKADKPKIVLISHVYSNPYWQYVKKGAEDAAKERGAVIEFKGPNTDSIKEGIKFIDMAIYAKVQGIITYVQDENEYKPYINKAIERGIPLITVDSDAETSNRLAYVGTDNVKAGEVAAKELMKKIGTNGNVFILMGGKEVKNQIERVKGFSNYISTHSNIHITNIEGSGAYLLESELATRKILSKNHKINAIFCPSALGSVGAAKAVESMNLKGKVSIIGFDDLPETIANISKGVTYATIVQRPYEMGYKSVNLIMDNLQGKKINGKYITDVKVVDESNLDSYLRGDIK